MDTSKIIFNIPTTVKNAAAKRASKEGLTLTAVLTQAAQAYGEGRIGIQLVETSTPRSVVARRLRTASKDRKDGRNISPTFNTAEGAITWLRSDM